MKPVPVPQGEGQLCVNIRDNPDGTSEIVSAFLAPKEPPPASPNDAWAWGGEIPDGAVVISAGEPPPDMLCDECGISAWMSPRKFRGVVVHLCDGCAMGRLRLPRNDAARAALGELEGPGDFYAITITGDYLVSFRDLGPAGDAAPEPESGK